MEAVQALMKAVVSDSTVLIDLAKIDCLFLLKEMFQEIHVPEAVFREVTQDGWRKLSEMLRGFFARRSATGHRFSF